MTSDFRKASMVISEKELIKISSQFPAEWPGNIEDWKLAEWSVIPEKKPSPAVFEITIVLRRSDDAYKGHDTDLIRCFLIRYEKYQSALDLVKAYLKTWPGVHKVNSKVDLQIQKRSFSLEWIFDSDSYMTSQKPCVHVRHTKL